MPGCAGRKHERGGRGERGRQARGRRVRRLEEHARGLVDEKHDEPHRGRAQDADRAHSGAVEPSPDGRGPRERGGACERREACDGHQRILAGQEHRAELRREQERQPERMTPCGRLADSEGEQERRAGCDGDALPAGRRAMVDDGGQRAVERPGSGQADREERGASGQERIHGQATPDRPHLHHGCKDARSHEPGPHRIGRGQRLGDHEAEHRHRDEEAELGQDARRAAHRPREDDGRCKERSQARQAIAITEVAPAGGEIGHRGGHVEGDDHADDPPGRCDLEADPLRHPAHQEGRAAVDQERGGHAGVGDHGPLGSKGPEGQEAERQAGTSHAAASSCLLNRRRPKQSMMPASATATSAIDPP